ncbi:hypothetical protein IPA_04675 [Ignicoccus pacificus DSM 13166]|uniref:Uncharacterized protein n=1 Tax=Ignicoccus pacificus DSM 13166 TaxID=940294 RepID=A0A977PKX2_9CREN|nr:hypothetical protein IPA_04675 [Ignicoccus pacificus DSM 13166]
MDPLDVVYNIIDDAIWYFRAKDAKIREGEAFEICELETSVGKESVGEDVEESLKKLIKKSREFWSDAKCRAERTVVGYDMRHIVIDREKIEELYRSVSRETFRSVMYLKVLEAFHYHYINHKLDFKLERLISDNLRRKVSLTILARSRSLTFVLSSLPELLDFISSHILWRASLRALMPKELLIDSNPRRVRRIMLKYVNKPIICIAKNFCVEYDLERGLEMRDDELLGVMVYALISTSPSRDEIMNSFKNII